KRGASVWCAGNSVHGTIQEDLMNVRFGFGMLAIAGGLAAAPLQAGPAVTVYSHDLGFVRETRSFELDRGRDTVRIPVPERIDFSSVRLAAPDLDVLRLAYRFDVASGDGALDHARGGQVRLTLRGDRVVEGAL